MSALDDLGDLYDQPDLPTMFMTDEYGVVKESRHKPQDGLYPVASIAYSCPQKEVLFHLMPEYDDGYSEALTVGSIAHLAYPKLFWGYMGRDHPSWNFRETMVAFEPYTRCLKRQPQIQVNVIGYPDAVVFENCQPVLVTDLKTANYTEGSEEEAEHLVGYKRQLNVYCWLTGVREWEIHYLHKKTGKRWIHREAYDPRNAATYFTMLSEVHAAVLASNEDQVAPVSCASRTYRCRTCRYNGRCPL
jgi:hypothetical protein